MSSRPTTCYNLINFKISNSVFVGKILEFIILWDLWLVMKTRIKIWAILKLNIELRYHSLVPSLNNLKSFKIIFRLQFKFLTHLLDNYGDRRMFCTSGTRSSSYLSRPRLTQPVGSRRLLTREPAEHPTPNLGFRSFRFKSYSVYIHLLY